jgi:hypothetical protein
MSSQRFKYLFSKYLNGTLSFNEKAEFFGIVEKGHFDDEIEADFESFYTEGAKGSENHIVKKIRDAKNDEGVSFNVTKMVRRLLRSAAAIVFFVFLCLYFSSNNKQADRSVSFFTEFVKLSKHVVKNNNKITLDVLLPDSSIISLQPASTLYYSDVDFASKRQVYMDGEASFSITKNPESPFFVYYKSVVTKVLGTSFHIYTNPATGNIEIEVLTGKVQVYENEQIIKRSQKVDQGVIVTPNQKAVYEKYRHILSATLVDEPRLLSNYDLATNKQQALANFNFNNSRMAEVINNIELNYGVKIVVNDDRIYDYRFSGQITSQNLFDKLKIICLATNTNYIINGTSVLITDAVSSNN